MKAHYQGCMSDETCTCRDDEEIDHEYTDEIVCPWCGCVHTDSWERRDDEGQDDCSECHKPFYWSRNVTVAYSTEKKETKP